MSVMEFVKNLGFGWNLGDTMDARVHRDDRAAVTPEKQETAWGSPVTTPEMIKMVADAGFKVFRLPVSWSDFIGAAPEYTVREDFLKRVTELVDYGFDNGLVVVLNMHHEDWHFPSEENYPAASEKLCAVWTQIAKHFEPYSNNLIFEAMNEPRKHGTPVEWNGGDAEGREVVARLGHDFIKTVRATGGNNATRYIMVPLYAAANAVEAMEGFVPSGDENVIVSVHGYTPFLFALSSNYEVREWKAEYEKDIEDVFARIDKYFLSKGYPVILGETGIRNKRGNLADRITWAKYTRATALKYGVPCIWWDNGRIGGDERAEQFGLLDRRNLTWAYPEVADAYLGK